MANMCQVSTIDMLNAIPVMISGDALTFFSTHAKHCNSYEEAVNALRQLYNNPDKRARTLTKWQSLSLTEDRTNDSDESKVKVFRNFVAKLMSLYRSTWTQATTMTGS